MHTKRAPFSKIRAPFFYFQKKDRNVLDATPARIKLTATLRLLATGSNYADSSQKLLLSRYNGNMKSQRLCYFRHIAIDSSLSSVFFDFVEILRNIKK